MNYLNTPPRCAAGEVRSPLNVALLAALQNHGAMSLHELNYALRHVDGYSDDVDCTRLNAALLKLRQRNKVHRVPTPAGIRWAGGPAPDAHVATRPALTPPRRMDVMFGPVYVPGPGPTLRPGALDYKSIARRGHAC